MQPLDLGYKFKKIHDCFKASGNLRAKRFGLTKTQMDILFYLFTHSENVTQRELEKHFEIKHSTVIGILGRMEKNGFIEISVCENDRRQRSISLTQKAIDLEMECQAQRNAIENKFTKKLSEAEISQLRFLLDKVYDILKEDTPND